MDSKNDETATSHEAVPEEIAPHSKPKPEDPVRDPPKAKVRASPKKKRATIPKAKAKSRAEDTVQQKVEPGEKSDLETRDVKLCQALSPLLWRALPAHPPSPLWFSGGHYDRSTTGDRKNLLPSRYDLARRVNPIRSMSAESWSRIYVVFDFLQLCRPLMLDPTGSAESAVNKVIVESLGLDAAIQTFTPDKVEQRQCPAVFHQPSSSKVPNLEPDQSTEDYCYLNRRGTIPSAVVVPQCTAEPLMGEHISSKPNGLVPLFDDPPICPAVEYHTEPPFGELSSHDVAGSCLFNQLSHALLQGPLRSTTQPTPPSTASPCDLLCFERDLEADLLGIGSVEYLCSMITDTVPSREDDIEELRCELEREGALQHYRLPPETIQDVNNAEVTKEEAAEVEDKRIKLLRVHLLLVRLLYMADLIRERQLHRSNHGVANSNAPPSNSLPPTQTPSPDNEKALSGLEDVLMGATTMVKESSTGEPPAEEDGQATTVKLSKAKETAAIAAAKLHEIYEVAKEEMTFAPITPLTWVEFCIGYLRKQAEALDDLASLPMKLKRGAKSYESELVSTESVALEQLANALEASGYDGLTVDLRVLLLEFLVRRVSDTPMFRVYVERLVDRAQRLEKAMLTERRQFDKACETRIRFITKTLQSAFEANYDIRARFEAMKVEMPTDVRSCLAKIEAFGLSYPVNDPEMLEAKEADFQGSPVRVSDDEEGFGGMDDEADEGHVATDIQNIKLKKTSVTGKSGKGKVIPRMSEATSPKDAINTMDRLLASQKNKLTFCIDEFRNLPLASTGELKDLVNEVDGIKATQLSAWHKHEIIAPVLRYILHFMNPRRSPLGSDRAGHLYWQQRGPSFTLEVEAPVSAVHSLRKPFDRSCGMTLSSGGPSDRVLRQKYKQMLLHGAPLLKNINEAEVDLTRQDALRMFDGSFDADFMVTPPLDFPKAFPSLHPPATTDLPPSIQKKLVSSGMQYEFAVDGMAAIIASFASSRNGHSLRTDITQLAAFLEGLEASGVQKFSESFPDILKFNAYQQMTCGMHDAMPIIDPRLFSLEPISEVLAETSEHESAPKESLTNNKELKRVLKKLHLTHDPVSCYPSGPTVERPALWLALEEIHEMVMSDEWRPKALAMAQAAGKGRGLPFRYGEGKLDQIMINEDSVNVSDKRIRPSEEDARASKKPKKGLFNQDIFVPSQLVAAMNVGGGLAGRRARAARREADSNPLIGDEYGDHTVNEEAQLP
eukprot:GHVH01011162.1.p1 GENE.GHVH01011162.1~~GHVH01011162.1.p1  ORF type:complete len:1236 (+),score=210.69 GHVH01011162.1:49-3756(+)